MSAVLLAATDVDPVWFFVLAVVGFVCGVVVTVASWRVFPMVVVGVGLAAISFAGMLAWWP